jgi:hypothetical protein
MMKSMSWKRTAAAVIFALLAASLEAQIDFIDPGLGALEWAGGITQALRPTDLGIVPIPLLSGASFIGLESLVTQAAAQPDSIAAIAAILDLPRSDLSYIAYGTPRTLEEFLRLRFSPRATLERGGGECSDIHALGAWLLETAGGLGPDDVYVIQTFGVGGLHNVIIYRDPATGGWNIMNYGRIYACSAASPRQAVEAVYGNPGRYEVYQTAGPDSGDFLLRFLDRDAFTGKMQGLQFAPGLIRFDGVFGSVPGLGGIGPESLLGTNLAAGERRISFQKDGLDVRARLGRNGGLDSAGVAFLTHPAGENEWFIGAKVAAPNTQSVFGLFEFGLLSPDRWLWTTAGAGFRNMGSISTDHQGLPEFVPTAAHQQGARYRLFGTDQTDGFQLALDWNAHASFGLPIVLTESGASLIHDSSNGQFSTIDPNLFSWAALGADSSLRARWQFSPALSVGALTRYRGELNDPTLQVLVNAIELGADFEYKTERASIKIEALATPAGGIWAHDSRWRFGLACGWEPAPGLSVQAAFAGGQYIDRTWFLFTNIVIGWRVNKDFALSVRDELAVVNGDVSSTASVGLTLGL